MKKLTIIALTLITLIGCSKEEQINPVQRISQTQQNEFTGTWTTPDYFCDEAKSITINYLNDSTVTINNTELKIHLNTIKSNQDSIPWFEGQLRNNILFFTIAKQSIACTAKFTKQ